jgi:dihydrodipicolinate synthase/N-acetylneuraminate lyase
MGDLVIDWRGTIAGVVLPVTERHDIDWASLEAHLESFVGCGLSGVVVNADTGEGSFLTRAERDAVLAFAIARLGDRLPVVGGLCPTDPAAAVDEALAGAALGAAAYQVFLPASGVADAVAYYRELASATDVPLIVYQPPAPLGAGFDLDTLDRLAEIRGVAAIKESSWSRDQARLTAARFGGDRHDVALLSGEDTFILESIRLGADGVMLAAAAVDPAFYSRLFTHRYEPEGAFIQQALDAYLGLLFAPPLGDFRARLKAVLASDGTIATAAVRPPMTPVGDTERSELVSAVERGRARLLGLDGIRGDRAARTQ